MFHEVRLLPKLVQTEDALVGACARMCSHVDIDICLGTEDHTADLADGILLAATDDGGWR